MTATSRHRLLALVSIGVVTAFVLASQYAAAWDWAAIVEGKDDVNVVFGTNVCSAATRVLIMAIVFGGASVGEDFSVWHNASWWDNRSGLALPTAYHNFTLELKYDGQADTDSYSATTTHPDSGTHTLNATATKYNSNRQAHVNWTASIFVTGRGGCSASSSNYAWFTVS